ncbi:MAG: hypothetical protein EPO68_05890 [Planctomycetota bacterium]|nr:MAG: hypothetical protein EPO68_05890 [Planctomycetota bacterium]
MRRASPSGPGARSARDFERERADLLAAWMPALLHRLNNASSVVHGMAELLKGGAASGARAQHVELLCEQSRAVADVLRLLGGIALPRGEARAAVDLHDLLREPLELLDHLHKAQLSAALAARRGVTVVRARPDELRLLLCRLLDAATPGLWTLRGKQDPELALRVAGDRSSVRLALACREADGIEALADHAAALGARLRTRRFRGRTCARLEWSGVDAQAPA